MRIRLVAPINLVYLLLRLRLIHHPCTADGQKMLSIVHPLAEAVACSWKSDFSPNPPEEYLTIILSRTHGTSDVEY